MYKPTWVEELIYLGTFGIFFTFFFIFIRVFPVIAIAEVKSVARSSARRFLGKSVKHKSEKNQSK
jgi:molybdopterin-containing oxidoreductase family membrane subunit